MLASCWTIPIGSRCRQTPLGRGYNSMSELVFLFDLLLDLVCKLFRGAKHCTLRSCMRVHINLRGPTQNHFQARAGLFVFSKVIVPLEVTLLLTTFYVQLRLNFVVTLKVALWLIMYRVHTAGPAFSIHKSNICQKIQGFVTYQSNKGRKILFLYFSL